MSWCATFRLLVLVPGVDISGGRGGVIREVDPCGCVDLVGGGFGPPPEPLDEHMYLLVQVQCGSP